MNITARLIAFEKVKKTIESCETIKHFTGADHMIDNFKALYGSDNEFSRDLDRMWLSKVGKATV